MKSTERHELAKNELAEWLGGTIKSIKPYLIYGLMAALAVVIVVYFVGKQRRAAQERNVKTAEAFSAAMMSRGESAEKSRDKRIEAYKSFLATHKGATQERTALSNLAGDYYERALAKLTIGGDAEAAKADLVESRKILEQLAAGDDEIATWAAGYDLACVTAIEGDKAKAREMLAATVKEHEGTALGTIAKSRLTSLEKARELVFDPEPKPKPDPEDAPPVSIAKPDKPVDETSEDKPEVKTPEEKAPEDTPEEGTPGEAKPDDSNE